MLFDDLDELRAVGQFPEDNIPPIVRGHGVQQLAETKLLQAQQQPFNKSSEQEYLRKVPEGMAQAGRDELAENLAERSVTES